MQSSSLKIRFEAPFFPCNQEKKENSNFSKHRAGYRLALCMPCREGHPMGHTLHFALTIPLKLPIMQHTY